MRCTIIYMANHSLEVIINVDLIFMSGDACRWPMDGSEIKFCSYI